MIPTDSQAMTNRSTARDIRTRLLEQLPVSDRRITAAGITTAVLEGGEGPPLILLHGPGEFGATWMRVIPDLVSSHRVVVPDLPGHGATGLPSGDLDRARVLQWLDELNAQTCDSPPDLAGHLLGGAIAARYAAEFENRVDRLVLVDSFGLSWLMPAPSFAFSMLGFLVRPNERTQERLFRGCFVDLDTLRDEMGEQMNLLAAYALEGARSPGLKAALRNLMPQFGVPPIPSEVLGRIHVPTALIWGRDDLQVRLDVAKSASTRYGWPLHVIDGAADDPAVEQPADFLEALYEALAARVQIS